MPKHVVAAVSEFSSGTRKLIGIGKRATVVFNVDGEFFAVEPGAKLV